MLQALNQSVPIQGQGYPISELHEGEEIEKKHTVKKYRAKRSDSAPEKIVSFSQAISCFKRHDRIPSAQATGESGINRRIRTG